MPMIAEDVVEFSYTVILDPEDLVFDEEEGRWRMTEDAKEGAYEALVEGITDQSGDWFPRYRVLCQREFMAGQICERERDHEGGHA